MLIISIDSQSYQEGDLERATNGEALAAYGLEMQTNQSRKITSKQRIDRHELIACIKEVRNRIEAYTGGCACGAIHYEISAEPVVTNDCQCRDCQRESGTGHGSHLTFPRIGVKLKGEAKHWGMVGDSGNVKTRAFCPTCGSPVYMTFAAMPDLFTVRAASLDDPSRYEPQMVTYGVRGYAWDHIDPALPKFDKMPPM